MSKPDILHLLNDAPNAALSDAEHLMLIADAAKEIDRLRGVYPVLGSKRT